MNIEEDHIWHPYANIPNKVSTYHVESADGVHLNFKNGLQVIDGMSSWWCMIHGYNNNFMNEAIKSQIDKVSHVMFGGLTHQPAIDLCKKLISLTPKGLDKVFFADSGSVSVEVSLKMALQYWQNKGYQEKSKFLTPRGGYHGDTFGAMSVCDPDNGMHHLFKGVLPKHFFVERPKMDNVEEALHDLDSQLKKNHEQIAAMILEPIVQGAGGMNIYHRDYLKGVRHLCDKHNVLLIVDEIATGFGRTGTVDWQTGIKTSTITAVNGEGYFVNTTGGAITANLPAGSSGAIVAFKDYANTFDSNALTVSANGSEKIQDATEDFIVSTEGESLTLVYADATKGWLVVNDGNADAGSTAGLISASGGTESTVDTNFKVHIFTGPGTFTVNSGGGPTAVLDYI